MSTTRDKINEFIAWCERAPGNLQVSAAWVAEQLRAALEQEEGCAMPAVEVQPAPVETSWRERIWTVPDETRLTVDECAEALGKSRAWLYARGDELGIPYRVEKSGRRAYVAGEITEWIRRQEFVVIPGSLARQRYAS